MQTYAQALREMNTGDMAQFIDAVSGTCELKVFNKRIALLQESMVFFNHHKERHHPPESAIYDMSLPYFPMDDHTIMLNFIENILCHFESCFPCLPYGADGGRRLSCRPYFWGFHAPA